MKIEQSDAPFSIRLVKHAAPGAHLKQLRHTNAKRDHAVMTIGQADPNDPKDEEQKKFQ